MFKTMRKMLCVLLVFACFTGFCSCKNNDKDSSSGNSSGGENPSQTEVDASFDGLEKDFVYAYELHDKKDSMAFQGVNYALALSGEEGKIYAFKPLNYPEKYFVPKELTEDDGADITFFYEQNGVTGTATGVVQVQNSNGTDSGVYKRTIENGRYVQRVDVPKLVYDNYQNIYGKLEVKAKQNGFAIGYEVLSPRRVSGANLAFNLSFAKYRNYSESYSGRVKTLSDGNDGLAFIVPSDGSVSVEKNDDGIRVSKQNVKLATNDFTGFGILCIPFTGGDFSGVENALNAEKVTLGVNVVSPVTASAQSVYNGEAGEFVVDGNIITKKNYYDYSVEENRNSYDEYKMNFRNPTNADVTVDVDLLKNTTALRSEDRFFDTAANFGMSGMCPMICDSDGNPTGIKVQTSKNWHSYSSSNVGAVERNYTGQWFSGTTSIKIPANSQVEYIYKIAYENWGEVASVSHSSLSLIGWDMYRLWEQLALGSHGENICFYTYASPWVQDIRPYLVTNHHGLGQRYNWSGNTGGAELLRYEDGSFRARDVIVTNTDMVSQGPNLTDVRYAGYTADGKIKTDITIHLLRTDDVTRVLYDISYTMLEDVKATRMTLFQYATEKYQANFYRKYAYGNDEGIIESGATPTGDYEFFDSPVEQKIEVNGNNPWFMLYDFNTELREETNGISLTVREFDAVLNGKKYTSPAFNKRKISEGQLAFELTTPKAAGTTYSKGSTINMLVEMTVLPQTTDTWYGFSDYMKATKNIFDTAEQGLQQAKYGAVTVSATVGKATGSYPVVIKTEKGSVAAEFTLIGGLGYVPVRFEGLESYSGYKLQKYDGNGWVDVDQSVKGKDFVQCDYVAVKGDYTLTYNVKNTYGTNYLNAVKYRLIYGN